MGRKGSCLHCKCHFNPVRKGHFFCSETCRKLAHKAKKKAQSLRSSAKRVSLKLERLAASVFGRYLVREIKRAQTVEVLFGHNKASLDALSDLRSRCTKVSGYVNGEPLGTYELSHIWPVSSGKTLGLLHPLNLIIAPKTFNRKHSQTSPKIENVGKFIPRVELDAKWYVTDDEKSIDILKKARSYLGKEFDTWLSGFVLSISQKQALIKNLIKNGLSKNQLQNLNLSQLKAIADEEAVPYFDLNRTAEPIISILSDETSRLEFYNDLTASLCLINAEEFSLLSPEFLCILSGNEKAEFYDFCITQTLLMLHGQDFKILWKNKPLISNFDRLSRPNLLANDRYDNECDDII